MNIHSDSASNKLSHKSVKQMSVKAETDGIKPTVSAATLEELRMDNMMELH